LNDIARKKYPTAKALENDLVNILLKLGFSREKSGFLASRIVVDDARGSGHAWGPEMRAEKAHLRTRVPDDGMNYKGYVIAVHEFGHNVQQIISLNDVDYYMMQGVSNSAFSEALAFIFQERNLALLGMPETNPDKNYLRDLDTFWGTYQIMGVSLVDMRAWKWLYEHPEADARQLKEAVIRIAEDVWNNYYAGVLGGMKDEPILAVCSHMVHYPLYLSRYSYGQLIKFQIEQYIDGKDFAAEIERMFSMGRLTPNLWMKNAVGKEISSKPLLEAAEEAMKYIK
jgi:oligoendopeptidase F